MQNHSVMRNQFFPAGSFNPRGSFKGLLELFKGLRIPFVLSFQLLLVAVFTLKPGTNHDQRAQQSKHGIAGVTHHNDHRPSHHQRGKNNRHVKARILSDVLPLRRSHLFGDRRERRPRRAVERCCVRRREIMQTPRRRSNGFSQAWLEEKAGPTCLDFARLTQRHRLVKFYLFSVHKSAVSGTAIFNHDAFIGDLRGEMLPRSALGRKGQVSLFRTPKDHRPLLRHRLQRPTLQTAAQADNPAGVGAGTLQRGTAYPRTLHQRYLVK